MASVEETLALWAAALREIKQRIRPLFTQERVARNAGLFLEGLLGDEQRKTGWMRAEAAGDPGPWRQQAILGRRDWDADALRDVVRDYVIEHLADDDAVLVIDETGFLKQGKASCGVARQYTGSAGKITNCQIGVFASYVSRHGHAFIDRALYLPKEWTDDPDRLEAVYVPPDVGFATKPKLATRMIARAMAASVPFRWVTGDTVYDVGDIEQQLRRAGKGYVLGVSSAHVFRSWSSGPGASGGQSPARRKILPGRNTPPTGNACLREREPKDRGCMIGVISNWPILRPKRPTIQMKAYGRAVCWCVATSPMAISPSLPPGVRREHRSKRWWRSRVVDGRSRIVLRPRRTSSGSITTRAGPGMVGTVMYHWRCSPSP